MNMLWSIPFYFPAANLIRNPKEQRHNNILTVFKATFFLDNHVTSIVHYLFLRRCVIKSSHFCFFNGPQFHFLWFMNVWYSSNGMGLWFKLLDRELRFPNLNAFNKYIKLIFPGFVVNFEQHDRLVCTFAFHYIPSFYWDCIRIFVLLLETGKLVDEIFPVYSLFLYSFLVTIRPLPYWKALLPLALGRGLRYSTHKGWLQ